MIEKLILKKNYIKDNFKIHVRKKAISLFKNKLLLVQKKTSDFSIKELESFIAQEEKKILNDYRNRSLSFLLLLLGVNIF